MSNVSSLNVLKLLDISKDITAQWNLADPLNSIYSEICTLFKTY